MYCTCGGGLDPDWDQGLGKSVHFKEMLAGKPDLLFGVQGGRVYQNG